MSMPPIRICVIAPAHSRTDTPPLLEALRPVTPPDVLVDIRHIREGSPCVENRTDWQENGMAVVRLARELAEEGYDGLWVADFDMCGVEAAREVVDIPVAGGFVPAVFTALGLSGRFSILTLSQSTLAMQRSHARAYGVDGALASVRQLNCSPDDLNHTELVVNKALEQAVRAVQEDGAEAIVLGHTGLIQVARRVSELLEDILGVYVPVIDPNQAGFGFLLALTRMGLRPGRLTYTKVKLPS